VNQVVSYWLLPLLTENTEHEDQGMIATLLGLQGPQSPQYSCKFHLIDISSNIRQHTHHLHQTLSVQCVWVY